MTLLELWVIAFDATVDAWDKYGSAPYLSIQDYNTNYVSDIGRNNNSGYYTFDTSTDLGTINTVTLYMYGEAVTTTNYEAYINDSATGLNPPTTAGWVSIDVTGIVGATWAGVNVATLLLDRPNTTELAWCDAAYLEIDYTGGATTQSMIETVALLDTTRKDASIQYTENPSITEFLAKSATSLFTEVIALFSNVNTATFSAYSESFTEFPTLLNYTYMGIQTLKEDSVSLTDTVLKTLSVSYEETTSFIDYLAASVIMFHTVLDSITLTSYLRYLSNWSRYPVSVVSLATDVDTEWTAYQLMVESLTPTDYLISAIAQLVDILQLVALTDSINTLSTYFYTIIETQTLSDIISPAWTAYTSLIDTIDVVSFWDYFLSGILSQLLTEVVDISDYITYVNTTIISLSDSLVSVDMMIFNINKMYINALTLVDALDYISPWKRALLENPSISDFWNISTIMTRLYTEQVTLLDSLSSSLGELIKSFIEAVNVSHYIKFGIEQRFYNTLSIADSITKGIVELVTRFIRLRFIGDD